MNQQIKLTLQTMSLYSYVQLAKHSKGFCYSCLLCFGIILGVKTAAQSSFDQSAQVIDSYFSRLEGFGLSGSLLIGNKQEILFQKDYGQEQNRSDIELAYLVGSLTKQFTATAILWLEQKGLLSTDDPVAKYLADIPSDKTAITLHQLLTHTSGLADDYWDQHKELTEKAYIKTMLSKDLVSKPGTRFRYINFGYHLLAKVIESVSKKGYEQFLAEELLRPNGLNYTGFRLPSWEKVQVAKYTDWTTEGSESILQNPLQRPVYLQPEGSGGLLSTTEDLYKWYQCIFHSDKVLTEGSRKKLIHPEQQNYAYGWEAFTSRRDHPLIQHGGYDSWVGVVTGLRYYLEEDLVVIFLGNTHMGELLTKDDLMNSIETIIWGGDLRMPPSNEPDPDKLDLNKYTGTYGRDEGSITLEKGKRNNQLRMRTTDPSIIQQLLLPANEEKRTDVQLEQIFDQINKDDFASLEGLFSGSAPIEAIRARYLGVWKNLTSSMGEYQGLQVLHCFPNIYEGQFELQFFVALLFERGQFYARVFRDDRGRIHIQPQELPKKLEIFLVPVGEGVFLYWNIKSGLSARIEIKGNQLIINKNHNEALLKR